LDYLYEFHQSTYALGGQDNIVLAVRHAGHSGRKVGEDLLVGRAVERVLDFLYAQVVKEFSRALDEVGF